MLINRNPISLWVTTYNDSVDFIKNRNNLWNNYLVMLFRQIQLDKLLRSITYSEPEEL